MIQAATIVTVCDKTGVILAQCIKVLGPVKKKIALIGDVIIVTVRHINARRFRKVKLAKKKKFFRGTLHRALVVRTRTGFRRTPAIYIRFNENAVVIVNKRTVPISNRVYGPVPRELCTYFPSLGCTTRHMI